MMLTRSPRRTVKTFVVLLVLSLNALHAGEPAFGLLDQKIDLPQSLLDGTKLGSASAPMTGGMPAALYSPSPHTTSPKKYVSKMPVLVPKADLDPKFVKAPDSTVDYKLIIKTLDVGPEK